MGAFAKTALHSDPILDVSYLSLRKSIGWIGILMPWVARAVANIRDGTPLLMSISAYYYSPGRDVFVGSLFAAGVFLMFYKGSLGSVQDRILAVPWGLAAMFIGLIPMNPCGDPQLTCIDRDHQTFHFVPVSIFFAINFYMTVFRFTKPSQVPVTRRKETRNKVYVVSGIVMALAGIAIAVLDHFHLSIFWPETIAIAVFGIAWLVKGQMILGDNSVK
jgi:hypothetical protein